MNDLDYIAESPLTFWEGSRCFASGPMWRDVGDKMSLPSGILRRRAAGGGIPQGELILFPETLYMRP